MKRYVANPGILVHQVLGPVAVMNVPVDNKNPPGSEFFQRRPRGHDHVAHEAEPHGRVSGRMVPRRTNQRKSRLAVVRLPSHFHCGASRVGSRFETSGTQERVAVDHPSAPIGDGFQLVQVTCGMHSSQLRRIGWGGL